VVVGRCRHHRSPSRHYCAGLCDGGGDLGYRSHWRHCVYEMRGRCGNGDSGSVVGIDVDAGPGRKRCTVQTCYGTWRMAACHCTASSSSYTDRTHA